MNPEPPTRVTGKISSIRPLTLKKSKHFTIGRETDYSPTSGEWLCKGPVPRKLSFLFGFYRSLIYCTMYTLVQTEPFSRLDFKFVEKFATI